MATIIDVAKKAGVSKTLVSRYLNGKSGVSQKSREAIVTAIKELKYRPNHLARSLVLKQTNTIGIVMDSLCTPFYFDFIRGLEESGYELGYNTLFSSSDEKKATKTRYIEYFSQGRTDGIIIYGSSLGDSELIENLAASDFPFVVVEHDVEGIQMNRVLLDNVGGAATAVEHLIALGCIDIMHFMGDLNKKVSLDRCNGYLKAMEQNGLKHSNESIIRSEFTERSGYEHMMKLIEKGEVPEGIFFSGDITAYGAIRALYEKGLRVPEDVKIVGFDEDLPESRDMVFPVLTTMKQPLKEMGKCALDILVKAIEGENSDFQTVMFKPELIINETCGAKS